MRRLSLIALSISTLFDPIQAFPKPAKTKREIQCSCPETDKNPANNADDWYCGDHRLGRYHIPESLPRSIFTDYYRFGDVHPAEFFTKFYNDDTHTWVGAVNPAFQAHKNGATFEATPQYITPNSSYSKLDGFGCDNISFAFLHGTPYAHRSIAPNKVVPDNYQHFTVAKPFWASVGRVPPWFGQPGGGLGFFLMDGSTWGDLVGNGTLANTTSVDNAGRESPNVC